MNLLFNSTIASYHIIKPTFDPTFGGNFDSHFTSTFKAWNFTTTPYNGNRDAIIIGTFGAGGGATTNNPNTYQRPALLSIHLS